MIIYMKDFRWHDWNLGKMAKHGVKPAEAESVVRNARRPYPRQIGDGKWLVVGRGQGDRVIEVVYVHHDDATFFVIHAMPLTTRRRRS
jgi:hypothetical protein